MSTHYDYLIIGPGLAGGAPAYNLTSLGKVVSL
jgi:choline dehydrogenase-like flavoprotein